MTTLNKNLQEARERVTSLLIENMFVEGSDASRLSGAKSTVDEWISYSKKECDLTYFESHKNFISIGIECEGGSTYVFSSSAVVSEMVKCIKILTDNLDRIFEESLKTCGDFKNSPFQSLKDLKV